MSGSIVTMADGRVYLVDEDADALAIEFRKDGGQGPSRPLTCSASSRDASG